MACLLFPCCIRRDGSGLRAWLAFAALLCPALSIASEAPAPGSPPSPVEGTAEVQKDSEFLPQDETYFAPVLSDVAHALAEFADVSAMTHAILEGGSPHLVLFLEGKAFNENREHPAVGAMRTLAENYKLGLESQATTLDDGAPLFGFLLYQRFPTLEMAWETHPHESAASVDGAWRQPFADLSDVESVHVVDDRATLVLSEAAARRIDNLSELHGHRNYRVRGTEMAEAANLGTYTWVPGLRTIPGVPAIFNCRLPRRDGQWKEGLSLDYLRQRFTVHAAARERIRRELSLADDVCWTISAVPPRYAEPFFAWVVHAPEAGGQVVQLPWYRSTGDTVRRWLHVQAPASPTASAVIPHHWEFIRQGDNAELIARPASGPDAVAREEAFAAFMRQNIGEEMAIVMQGQVAGVVAISAARPELLSLGSMPPAASVAMERLWNAANSGPVGAPLVAASAPIADAPVVDPPDTFQVRLMAEPQDREFVEVTHFAAPGYAPGTVAAVLENIIVDGRAVTGAFLETRDDKLYLRLTFTAEAQEVLGGACFGNMGKQLAILYNDRLLCAPTIDEWEIEELTFKGMDSDWPEVARDLAEHLNPKG